MLTRFIEKAYGAAGLRGKRVVDLGSGTGFTGLMAAALGAETVHVTDQEQLQWLLQVL